MNHMIRPALCLPQRRGLATSSPLRIVTALRPHDTPTIGDPTSVKLTRINFPPFVKDLFAGQFNQSVLSYAEVLNYERYFALEEQTGQLNDLLCRKRQLVEGINERGQVPDELLSKLRDLDVFGLTVPKQYGGLELMHTEIVRLYEVLGMDLSLSELININEFFGTKAIVDHGTPEQKEKYLPGLSSGEIWSAFCLAEARCGSDPNSVETRALWLPDEGYYKLSGTKTWVANALRAKVFLVFAQLPSRNYLGETEHQLTAFLVDRDQGGVEISLPYDLAGANGLQVCDVTFNTTVPVTGLLGAEGEGQVVLQSVLHQNKYFMAAGVLRRLKMLLDITVEHVLARKQYGQKLSDFELIKFNIAKCCGRIYALESMLYMTAGLGDVGIKPDIEVESAIVKQFAVETSDFVTRRCLDMLGAQTNVKGSPFQQFLAENQVLQSWQGSSNILKCFIAISGILHLTEKKGEEMMKCRNPGLHPIKFLKYEWGVRCHRSDRYPLKHKLENYVHPRLDVTARAVEWAVHKLPFCTETILLGEGSNIQVSEAYLERLSDAAMEIYAMVCSLSRASRSYVVGHPHAEHEICTAIPFIFESRLRVKQKLWECMNSMNDHGNRDAFLRKCGNYVIEKGGYCAVSPITKNSF